MQVHPPEKNGRVVSNILPNVNLVAKKFKCKVNVELASFDASAQDGLRLDLADFTAGKTITIINERLLFRLCDGTNREAGLPFTLSEDPRIRYSKLGDDFGPFDIGCIFRFCQLVNRAMKDAEKKREPSLFISSSDLRQRTNAAFFISAYLILKEGKTPEEAFHPFACIDPYPFEDFRDSTTLQPCPHNLKMIDTLRGLYKAIKLEIFNMETFDLQDFEHYRDPAIANAHVVVPGKFIALKGPVDLDQQDPNAELEEHDPSVFESLFRKSGVSAVVCVSENRYDPSKFRRMGLDYHNLAFDDASVPSQKTVEAFLDVCQREKGAIAIHCKAGLGRTGTLIAAWLIMFRGFLANEAIAWVRLVRPGSIVGPQPAFLVKLEQFVRAVKVTPTMPNGPTTPPSSQNGGLRSSDPEGGRLGSGSDTFPCREPDSSNRRSRDSGLILRTESSPAAHGVARPPTPGSKIAGAARSQSSGGAIRMHEEVIRQRDIELQGKNERIRDLLAENSELRQRVRLLEERVAGCCDGDGKGRYGSLMTEIAAVVLLIVLLLLVGWWTFGGRGDGFTASIATKGANGDGPHFGLPGAHQASS